jgi:hypothetical protein
MPAPTPEAASSSSRISALSAYMPREWSAVSLPRSLASSCALASSRRAPQPRPRRSAPARARRGVARCERNVGGNTEAASEQCAPETRAAAASHELSAAATARTQQRPRCVRQGAACGLSASRAPLSLVSPSSTPMAPSGRCRRERPAPAGKNKGSGGREKGGDVVSCPGEPPPHARPSYSSARHTSPRLRRSAVLQQALQAVTQLKFGRCTGGAGATADEPMRIGGTACSGARKRASTALLMLPRHGRRQRRRRCRRGAVRGCKEAHYSAYYEKTV